ncbi:olfactory receptor 52D1-like [Carettochelys insculpta]|uniref:olfactory receptor 52D1-like n=1 Tax=Carettochelys insculpta TaxID=44489 RepID=UPI003EBBF63B
MATFNLTFSEAPTFILTGIPGLEHAHIWISIPFSISYIVVLLGNFTVLLVVGKEQTLHKPMYLLFCMLAITDIIITTSVIPKTLCIFWFNLKVITWGGCLTQAVFYTTLSLVQANVLLAMSFDRYIAICKPLRYNVILSHESIAKIGLVSLIRGLLFMLPLPLLLIRLPFCGNRIIAHTHCLPIAVAKISCGDYTLQSMYGVVIISVNVGLDLTLISLSYYQIIRELLRISSMKMHQKALNTCSSHISVLMLYYIPSFFAIMTPRFGQSIAPHIHVIMANLNILIPSMLNPIIYAVKTKELRDKVKEYIWRK